MGLRQVFREITAAKEANVVDLVGWHRAELARLAPEPEKKKKPHSEWKTDPEDVRELGYRYGPWDLDAAAAKWNAQCLAFITKEQNCLRVPWWGRVFFNPWYNPAGSLDIALARARQQALWNVRVVRVGNLIPHYTAEGWWLRHIARDDDLGPLLDTRYVNDELGSTLVRRYARMQIDEVRLTGRRSFISRDGQNDSARYSSAFVVFERLRR